MFTKLFVLLLVLVLVYVSIYCSFMRSDKVQKRVMQLNATETIICTVVCGIERTEESIVMIKSALIFTTPGVKLKFVLVTEQSLFELLEEKLESFQRNFPNFSYSLIETKFPNEEWRTLFKPCASQRLFLPSLLTESRVLYVDSDTLFLSPPNEIFQTFRLFNSTQIAALSTESENENTGWYSRFARHPFYGKLGLNSGVMLMDLARMRELKWEQKSKNIYETYNLRGVLVFGDQDIINIYFHFHAHELFLLPCEMNYRPDHCMYMSLCPAINGIKLIHGNRGYFHKAESQPVFSQIYDAILKVRLRNIQ